MLQARIHESETLSQTNAPPSDCSFSLNSVSVRSRANSVTRRYENDNPEGPKLDSVVRRATIQALREESPMRLTILAAFICALLVAPFQAKAEEPADSIQAVIESQLQAFQASDVEKAFTFASPGIQKIFQTPKNFGRMVEFRYPMVWRPRRHEMMQFIQTESGPVQVVLFEDTSGQLHEAGYLMELVEGRWRIAGVKLRSLPGVGT